ncbi:MAG TPA: glycosyltransferase family 39 protein [Acidimicrobiales bacterium]
MAIALVGLLRGLFWVATTEVWSPIDEAHHYGFVQSLATGHGIPTVGKDVMPVEVVEVIKASPTLASRSKPNLPVLEDGYWSVASSQYEAVQPPLYYVLLVPAYWLSRPFGFVSSIYGLRIGSVLIALAAVPLTWMLAKELFPRRPAVWLAAPAVLVAVNGFNTNLATIGNDALVVPVAALALLAAARFHRTPNLRTAALTGLALGAALLAKTTTLGLIGVLALPYLLLVVTRRKSLAEVLNAGAVTGAWAGAVLLPWVAWNLLTYGSPTAADASSAITGQMMARSTLSAGVLWDHVRLANMGFWDSALFSHLTGPPYERVWVWTVIAAVAVGLAVALARRDRPEAVAVAWVGTALPLAFVGMEAIVFGLFDGVGHPEGRHLYTALVPVSVLVAAAAVIALGPRWGLVAVAAVIALAFLAEQAQVRDYVIATYAAGRLPSDLAPVVDQPLNEGFVPVSAIRVDPPCPVRAVGLVVDGTPPATLLIGDRRTPLTGTLADIGPRPRPSDPEVQVYSLAAPLRVPFAVVAPEPFLVGASRADTDPHLALPGGTGDPVARLYCQVDDPERARFDQQFPPLHPRQIGYSAVQAWPRAWAGLGMVGLAAAVGNALRRPRR